MSRVKRFASTSIGSKAIVAITGLGLFLFLVAHLLGNLTLWAGRDAMNGYAEKLQSLGALLWIMRGGLLALFVVHLATALTLARQNKLARPVPYSRQATLQATWASRQMVLTGLLLLAFLIYHLLHFTFHVIPTGGIAHLENGHKDVYGMVVAGFSNPLIAISYMVANIVVGIHLIHGSRSLFQTLGWDHPVLKPIVNGLAPGLAIFVAGGNVLLPLSVLLGWVS